MGLKNWLRKRRMDRIADSWASKLAQAFNSEGRTGGSMMYGMDVPENKPTHRDDHYVDMNTRNVYVAEPDGSWRRLLWHQATEAQKMLLTFMGKRPADA